MNPSGIKRPEDEELQVVEVEKGTGLYISDNAYAGVYEYFSDRPIEAPESADEVALPSWY
jgi:hypothetical protein